MIINKSRGDENIDLSWEEFVDDRRRAIRRPDFLDASLKDFLQKRHNVLLGPDGKQWLYKIISD